MFGDGEGLQSSIKFAVAATYEKFAAKWDMPTEKLRWIDVWASLLQDLTVSEINFVADHCVREFRRPPAPAEFVEISNRHRRGSNLYEPIASRVERMAYLILSNDEFHTEGISNSEVSDACLIAAAISQLNSYSELSLKVDPTYLPTELSGRANMFAVEAARWQEDAHEGKGFWAGMFDKH